MAFEDLAWPAGQQNMGGLVSDVHFVPLDDVDMSAAPALDADGVTITAAITLKALKKWISIYHTRGTGKIDSNSVGERDGKSFENILEFNFPGGEKKVVAHNKQVLNTPGLYIGKDTDGNYRILGLAVIDGVVTFDMPAYTENITSTTGAASADKRGTTYQAKSEAPHEALFYEGAIDLNDTL